MCIPVILVSVANHGKHLRYGVIDTLYVTIAIRVVSARREFVDT